MKKTSTPGKTGRKPANGLKEKIRAAVERGDRKACLRILMNTDEKERKRIRPFVKKLHTEKSVPDKETYRSGKECAAELALVASVGLSDLKKVRMHHCLCTRVIVVLLTENDR